MTFQEWITSIPHRVLEITAAGTFRVKGDAELRKEYTEYLKINK